MANHQSALKRVRQNHKRRVHNRYYTRSMRNSIRAFRSLDNKKEAEEQLPKMYAMIDKVAQKSMIHKNKAANLKSSLSKHLKALA